ncbi:MAG: gliding motility-associated C-terminal domain-containing protein, partial [Ginsengibacter sp.]
MNYDYVPPPPPTPFTPKFHFYGVDFIMPPGINALVLKIKDDSANYSRCGYAFALDDIKFTALGPASTISFDDARYGETIMSTCFQNNKTIAMSGTVDPGFNNVAVQWQQTIDDGITWTDIPGATDYHYSHTFSVPDTFLFRMRASEADKIGNENCSIVSNTLRVEVDGIPSGIKVTNNSPVCAGDNLQFNAEGGISYIWAGPNGFYDNVSYAHIFHSVLADSGTYYVQVTTFGGCTATDSTHVTIIGNDVDVQSGSDQSVCKGKSVQLNASGGISYTWSPVNGLSDATIHNPKATPDITTTYTVKVSDQFGCSDSGSVTVIVLNSIAVKAIISGPAFVCFPVDTAVFSNKSLGEIIHSRWDFGNGRTSILFTPPPQIYTVDINRTDYTLRLTVADSSGCSDTAYQVMKVESNCYIAVPTAFTPNGDGLNDYLYPLNAYKATHLIFRVYNRQGQLLFQTRDWTQKWDGKVKGDPQTEGVYVWTLNYIDGNNKQVSLKGYT